MEIRLDCDGPIGVMDSGMGGISVLRELAGLLPHESFVFDGDSANAPYGSRSTEEIYQLTEQVVQKLLKRGAKAVVIACPGGRVVVLTTGATLRERKFARLLTEWQGKAEIIKLPLPGLPEFVERGELDSPQLREFLQGFFVQLADRPVDGVVLGCTHYPFVRKVIAELLGPQVKVFDGAAGTARQLRRRLYSRRLLTANQQPGSIQWLNSSPEPEMIELSKKLFTITI